MLPVFARLLLAGVLSFAQAAPASGCDVNAQDVQSNNDSIFEKARAQLHGCGTQGLQKCHDELAQHLTDCSRTKTWDQYCLAITRGSTSESGDSNNGLPQAQDSEIVTLLAGANCFYAISACYQWTSLDENYKKVNPYKDCNNLAKKFDSCGDGAVIRNYLGQYKKKIQDPDWKCLWSQGQDKEATARSVLEQGKVSQSDNATGGTIDCSPQDNGNRVCRYNATGGSRYKKVGPGDQHPTVGKTLFLDNKLRPVDCSGSVLGDGVTFVTAGHCTHDLSGKNQLVGVTDKMGNLQLVPADCSTGQFTQTTRPDISICKLELAVPTDPVYFATLDSSSSSSQCVTHGYIMQCGSGFFQDLTQKPVTMWAYPEGYNPVTRTQPRVLTETTGTLVYHADTHNLTTDMMCTGGCSGAGYYVYVNGRRVIVAANSYGSRYDPTTGAAVVPTQVLQGLKVQSISTNKLANGSMIFQEMPF